MSKIALKDRWTLFKTIASESFIEKIILLILTVLLSGLLIPYVSTEIQRKKIRNDTIIQSQTKLLDDVTRTLMTYETLLLDISWYQTAAGFNKDMQKKAFERYAERSVDLIADWRVESIKARTLSSVEVSKRLDSFQVEMFSLQDGPMNILYREKSPANKWQALHTTNEGMYSEARKLVADLAREMKLTKDNIK